jgi:nascent polypeptide-associated complex subunit alpha
MNPRQIKQAMRKLGIKTEDMTDVTEVVIKTPTKHYIIKDAAVTMMEVQGQKTFQIVGEPEIVAATTETAGTNVPEAPKIPEEDIKIVMEQAGVSRERAVEALKATDGQPAEAIIKLMS